MKKTQYENAKGAVDSLKDDGNDGHKLYAIAECMLSLTEQVKRIADIFDPPPMTISCSKCGANLTGKTHCRPEGGEPYCFGECENKL